jgi:hypothetical protein
MCNIYIYCSLILRIFYSYINELILYYYYYCYSWPQSIYSLQWLCSFYCASYLFIRSWMTWTVNREPCAIESTAISMPLHQHAISRFPAPCPTIRDSMPHHERETSYRTRIELLSTLQRLREILLKSVFN